MIFHFSTTFGPNECNAVRVGTPVATSTDHMNGGQNYLFPVIATGETGSSPIGFEDVRSLITSSSKCCSLY